MNSRRRVAGGSARQPADSVDVAGAAPGAGDNSESGTYGDPPAVADAPGVTRQMPVVEATAPIQEPSRASSQVVEVRTMREPQHAAGDADRDTAPATTGVAGDTGAPTETDGAEAGVEAPRHMRAGADAGTDTGADDEGPAGRELRTRALMAAPAVILILLIVAWALDTATHSGPVLRNVELAGRSIDGTSEDELPHVVSELAMDMAARKVTITSGDLTYETTAGELGLAVDQKATIDAAMDVGRGDSLFVRPFKWFGSYFTARKAPIKLSMSESQTSATLQALQGGDRTQPVEPLIQLTANGFVLVPGQSGVGIDVSEVTADLREAEPTGPIELDAEPQDVAPTFTDRQAQELADRANDITANGLNLKVDAITANVPPATLRGWLSQTVTDGKLDLAFNKDAAKAALPTLLTGLTADATNATMTLQNGQPVVVPAQNGVTCCGESSAERMWQAIRDKAPEVTLEAQVTEPEHTTAEVEAWKVVGPVGGNRGFQNGNDIPSGLAAGFTTYHGAAAADRPRNNNIERIADEVRGAVIPPGGEFSINDHVGRRTHEDGYVDAGAIRDSRHVQEVGGGISQFATTTFNAAYFAGLDILESQSHSEWFTRYPPGREATMGFPNPDLRIRNNTPYGVMIWTSYTPTSLTVTIYSTPHVKAEQTAKNESTNGVCRVVVTTRTRTYPDGQTEQDQFKSTYRPEGRLCTGAPVTG